MAGKKTSATQKACYTRYKNDMRWKDNRISKLEKHLVKHPEDEIAMAALSATKSATKPRRAGYKTNHVNRTAGHLVKQLAKLIKGAAKAAVFEQKKLNATKQDSVEEYNAVKKKARKPRHKATKKA